MSKKKTVSDGADDISINIFYSVKGSKKTRRLSLTPKEYFWRLTKRETKIITSTASRENGTPGIISKTALNRTLFSAYPSLETFSQRKVSLFLSSILALSA